MWTTIGSGVILIGFSLLIAVVFAALMINDIPPDVTGPSEDANDAPKD